VATAYPLHTRPTRLRRARRANGENRPFRPSSLYLLRMISLASDRMTWSRTIDALCGWSAVGMVFAAPVSRSLFLLAALLFVLSWTAHPEWHLKWRLATESLVARALWILATMVVVWTVFSPAPVDDAINNLKVYSKLLLVLMLQLPFSQAMWRQRAFAAFTAAIALVLLSTYANVFVDLPWSHTRNQGFGQDHSVFVEYVSQSVMTAIFVAHAVHQALNSPSKCQRIAWWLSASLALFSVVFLLQGRSGLVATVVVAAVLLILQAPNRLRWRTAVVVLALGTLLVVASPLMRDRLMQAYLEVIQHQPFDQTSLGARMDMWGLAWKTTWEHPLLGSGSGSYPTLANAYFGHCEMTCIHPHNQYLFFSMEFGLPVLGAYLALLAAIGVTAHRSVDDSRVLLWAWLAVVAIDGLFNVPLWYRAQSYFFYVMLGLLLASNLPSPHPHRALRRGDAPTI